VATVDAFVTVNGENSLSNSSAASKQQTCIHCGAHIQYGVRVVLGDSTLVDLPQVRSIVKTFGTNGFVRLEFPYKMVLKLCL